MSSTTLPLRNWAGTEGRCEMYCAGTSDEDWYFLCDCFEAERCLGPQELPPAVDLEGPMFE